MELGYEYAKENRIAPLPNPAREDGGQRRQDPDRRQHGDSAGLRLRRGDCGGVVSHHALDSRACDAFKSFCDKLPTASPTGEHNYIILQAEDELAAIGMVLGASWKGARSFTSTAGPGISLMNELIGLAYYAEIPAVIVDVQRVGPSTGMPTRTQQGDILAVRLRFARRHQAHLLFPANPRGVLRVRGRRAFDLAERFQTPVFMLTDLDIGMNDWVVPRLSGTTRTAPIAGACSPPRISRPCRSSPLLPGRRLEVAARTLPGIHSKGAYFTRGSGHNKLGGYTEIPDEYQEVMERLLRKHRPRATRSLSRRRNRARRAASAC